MPFTFSTESFTRPLAEFGNDSAQMILQTGATIQQGLQQMMTNRQVAALGQQLGSLNPESPEWAQQAVKLGSQYPLAMKSPAGQFMLGTQAKAHAQWQQAQTATARQQTQFGNAVTLENMRQRNRVAIAGMRPNSEVDLSGLPLPSRLAPQNPASAIGPTLSGEPLGEEPLLTDGEAPLPDANVDPLAARALRPLAEAQRLTGTKPSKAQVFGAIAGERTREQQEKMQEDRQAQQEKLQTERLTESARLKEEAALARKERDESVAATKVRKDSQTAAMKVLTEAKARVKAEEKRLSMLSQELEPGDFAKQQAVVAAAGEAMTAAQERFDRLFDEEEESPKTRIVEKNGKRYEVDDASKKVIRELP